MSMRALKPKPKFESHIDADALEGAHDIFDESELADAKSGLKAYNEAVKEAMARQHKLASALAKNKGRKQKAVAQRDLETVARARKYLPDIPECHLHEEVRWHTIWKISYPKEFPPFGFSRTFDPHSEESRRTALLECLRWCWRGHGIKTG